MFQSQAVAWQRASAQHATPPCVGSWVRRKPSKQDAGVLSFTTTQGESLATSDVTKIYSKVGL